MSSSCPPSSLIDEPLDEFAAIAAIQKVMLMIIEMHVLGFVAKRLDLLGPSAEEGLAAYVYSIGLPSLLFSQIATRLSFDEIDFVMVISILISKLLVAAFGVTLAHLVTREADGTGFAATLGGITVLLSTMSDDMGIGLPVFSAFFTSRPAWVTLHLIVLSALQSLLINPIVFVLLGVGRACADMQLEAEDQQLQRLLDRQPQMLRKRRPSRERDALRKGVAMAMAGLPPRQKSGGGADSVAAGTVRTLRTGFVELPPPPPPRVELWGVVLGVIKSFRKNMLVLSVVVGGSYNVLTGAAPLPDMVRQVSETAGQAFLPLVLLVAGMALSSSIGHLTNLRLAVLPTILVVLKSVVLPIVCSFVHGRLSDSDVEPVARDFAFFYGLLPVATSSLAIIRSYKARMLIASDCL